MREIDRLGIGVDAEELTERRTLTSKTYSLGGGKFRTVSAGAAIHYTDGDQLADIDLEPVDMGGYWLVDKAPFTLKVSKTAPQVKYAGKASGLLLHLYLNSAAGSEVNTSDNAVVSHPKGVAIQFGGVLPDADLHLVVTPSGIVTERTITGPQGLVSLAWLIHQNHPEPVITEVARMAVDASGTRSDVQINRSALVQKRGLWEHTFEEVCSGLLLVRDKKTRTLSTGGPAAFPIRVIS